MFLRIKNVLDPAEVTRLEQLSRELRFVDGRISNPANQTKDNLQADPSDTRSAESSQLVHAALLRSREFVEFTLPPSAKRVVTFLQRSEDRGVTLPLERDGARVLKLAGSEVFTAYEPSPKGPVFMTLLERTFGRDITTRTLATVERCATA